ncbi:hypothetical protein FRB94_010167 [Tulasnella sp. JGI-2019a]|nr:hypothetical protein FRB93_008882 [Tulasnella sp. JGI-2019a]KAG8994085.1 hypothetical protein FRB94_010167 [Tulasnella sp. JGI-2019a]KAG9035575.1 hypothetical protein FRB95_011119 [Tulasnella sp. JGI-2019a]
MHFHHFLIHLKSQLVYGLAELRTSHPSLSPTTTKQKMASDKELALQAETDALEKTLQGEDPQKVILHHIKLLHEYNEIKDMAQVIIGRLASLKGTSIKQLHEDYGLLKDD